MQIRPPETDEDFERYYALRWRLLREPWGQPKGSERDEHEDSAWHRMARLDDGTVVGVARLHRVDERTGRIRYMAVAGDRRGRGIGGALLAALETAARDAGMSTLVLQARAEAEAFYRHRGYAVTGPAPTLFGRIPHVHMRKALD